MGIMLYELLMGVTPFHAYEMKELIGKINEGKYELKLEEPISIECALFLSQCLQTNESNRLDMEQIAEHPFINDLTDRLTQLNKQTYF
jgi:serine/threonine protein kinase